MRMELAIDPARSVSFQVQIPLLDFPRLVNEHTQHYRATDKLELLGAEVVSQGFPEAQLAVFIRDVCSWGGYGGIAGRVLSRNSLTTISEQFTEAAHQLIQEQPNFKQALEAINGISGLGTPSFASKHLRFMFPDICPILDSINKSLGYPFNSSGYHRFAQDCARISAALEEAQVPNPKQRPDGRWYVGEVDMAIFAYLNGW